MRQRDPQLKPLCKERVSQQHRVASTLQTKIDESAGEKLRAALPDGQYAINVKYDDGTYEVAFIFARQPISLTYMSECRRTPCSMSGATSIWALAGFQWMRTFYLPHEDILWKLTVLSTQRAGNRITPETEEVEVHTIAYCSTQTEGHCIMFA